MVQTLINEVRRLRTEQNNNLQQIQRLRAEQFLPTPPMDPPDRTGPPPQATPAGRGIIDTRIGKSPVFSGDENTWGDWSFKLRSCVSAVDLQLGRMTEAAELAAHANAWLPSAPLSQDMDAPARHADQRTRTADPAKRSAGIPRPCSKVQSAFASTFLGTAARAHAF